MFGRRQDDLFQTRFGFKIRAAFFRGLSTVIPAFGIEVQRISRGWRTATVLAKFNRLVVEQPKWVLFGLLFFYASNDFVVTSLFDREAEKQATLPLEALVEMTGQERFTSFSFEWK